MASSVHTVETTGRRCLPDSYQDYLRNRRPSAWAAAHQLYSDVDAIEFSIRTRKLDECRRRAWFAFDRESGMVKVMSNACKLRWCPLCAAARRANISHQTLDWLKTIRRPKFLTLTVKHSTDPLTDQIQRLYDCFRKFRKAKYIRKNVSAGIWFFQIKQSKHTGEFHPHLHCLLSANYMPHSQLLAIWFGITHDSTILDIRSIHDAEKAAKYVARYAATPCDLESISLDARIELFTAMHGRRGCGTWGSANDICLRSKRPDDGGDWLYIASWELVHRLPGRNELYKLLTYHWLTGTPIESASDIAVVMQQHMCERPIPPPDVVDGPCTMSFDDWLSL